MFTLGARLREGGSTLGPCPWTRSSGVLRGGRSTPVTSHALLVVRAPGLSGLPRQEANRNNDSEMTPFAELQNER